MEHTVLANRYELLSHLARGGMADVFEARDTLLGRRVAVKMLHSQYATDEAFVRRFRREAQAAANLSHPNIVGIFDWGQEAGTYFIVMELVEGKSVRDVLKEGPLLPRRAVEIASEVASALTVAHRAGVVHRDIKPGNIMLTKDGMVKVTDFGIARAWDDSSELTKTGAVIGTATYFSPEQAQGVPADERSDLYSLGVVLYEMLCGHPPFSGESPVSVAYQHVSAAVSAPSTINSDVTPDLDRIVLHALDKNPAARYQTAEVLREDLLLFLAGGTPAGAVSSEAPTEMMPSVGLPPATASPDVVYRRVQPERRPTSQLPFVITAFALLVALGTGIFLLLRQLPSAPPEPATISVPDVAGRPEADAMIEVQQAGFTAISENTESATVPENTVIGTDPPAFSEMAPGSLVKVLVSIGPKASPVPPLVGETVGAATELITQNGFVVNVTRRPDATAPKDQVITQDPPPGQKLPPNAIISIVVSDGPAIITIPSQLPGRTEGDVGFILGNEGLVPEFSYEYSDEQPAGLVVRTEPGAGEQLPAGGTIVVVVSQGPEPVAVPDLTGMTEEQARAALETAGLQLAVSATTVETGPEQDGKVVSQSIAVGVEVDPDTIVQVTLGKAPPTTTTSSSTTTTTTP